MSAFTGATALLRVLSLFCALSWFAIAARAQENNADTAGPDSLVVERILRDAIPFGKARIVHLDVNAFAVKIPGVLFVFDYANDEPSPQWDPFTRGMRSRPVRSLLTGVLAPEELAEESVVFLFSHDHPGELFVKTLGWKDQMKQVRYVITREIYEKNKDAIEKAEAADRIEIARPGHSLSVKNCVIRALPARACSAQKMCEGVEYLVETTNGVNVYHAGAKGCSLCVDTRIMDNPSRGFGEPAGVISSKTQKLIFRDGKLVSSDAKDSADSLGLLSDDTGVRNIGFAVYSTPEVAYGYMRVWATAVPQFLSVSALQSDFGRSFATHQELSAADRQRKKRRFDELDRMATSLSEPDGIHMSMNEIHEQYCQRDVRIYDELDADQEVLSALRKMTKRLCSQLSANLDAGEKFDFIWDVLQSDEERVRGDAPEYFDGYCVANGVGLHSDVSWKIFEEYNKRTH